MKKIILSILITFILTACSNISDKTQNLKLRKDCAESNSKETLADIFCKKSE